ncbi:Polyketide cyclase / dehydrase and lipid transport [Lentzea albidocapillata subsp. violacea]|uniref:Polyketide cyclase / dehydrase and lipid transport n=1 Tax=Lentzea albidocapillata subsp. violacea TaxID=128104 RepID=A0A1G9FX03_9PSEU|nr:Polyketide cyclase / dehydrase and lipid transport [Lentzea albidocapillata subsp. violacea]
MSTELELTVQVAAPPDTIFRAMTDWERQSEWVFGTRVSVVEGDGRSVGSEIDAVTFGVSDRMRITRWDPPHAVEVVHLGRVVRGTAVFAVRGSRFVWTERLDVPFFYPLVKPLFVLMLRRSLQRFARFAEEYR